MQRVEAMNIEAFSHLKEIQSLDNFIKKHLDAIKEEEGRLKDILALRERRSQELQSLTDLLEQYKKDTAHQEKELFDWEKKYQKAGEQLVLATNEKEISALEKEEKLSSEKIEEIQDEILDLLEKCEELEEKIAEAQEFLKGSLETVEEVKAEILDETKQERDAIEKYEKRIDALKSEIPNALWEGFSRAREKHRFNSSLARILNRACEKCRFQIDSLTANRVETATGVEQCSQCERLLIPLEA